MTKTLSMDIRSRFRRYIEEGWTGRAAGRALKISPASAVRFRRMILRGKGLDAKPRGGHRDGGKLAGFTDFLIELVSQDPDITLYELRDALEERHLAALEADADGVTGPLALHATASGLGALAADAARHTLGALF